MIATIRRLATVAVVLATYGLARLVFNTVGLRTIGAEAVGLVNLALALAVLLSLPASAGVAPVISRFMPLLDPGRTAARASFHRRATGTALLFTLPAALAFLGYRAVFSHAPHGMGFALLVVVWAGFYSLYSLSRAELFAEDSTGRALGLETVGFMLFAGSLVGLVWGRAPYWLPFSLYYLPAVIWVLLKIVEERRRKERLPFPTAEMRSFGLYAFFGSLASLGISQLSIVVVTASSGLTTAGLWATLMSVAAPLLLAPRSLNSAFFPRLSLLGRTSLEAFHGLSVVHQRFSSLLALLLVGTALVLARPGLALAVGTTGDASLLLSWKMICIAAFGIFRGEPVITATGALGQTRVTASAAFAGAGICLLFWLALVPSEGLSGVATGYMVFALAVPSIAWICARLSRERSAPRVVLFASDGLFALIAIVSLAGVEETPVQGLLLTGLVLALVQGARRIWVGLAALPEDARG